MGKPRIFTLHVNPGRAKRSVPFVYAAVMARLIQH